MSEPGRLSVKRKATDDPPDVLVLQKPTQNATHIRYVRQRRKGKDEVSDKDVEQYGQAPAPVPLKPAKQQRQTSRRVFELQHAAFRPASVTGKRKGAEDAVATFVERKKYKQTPDVGKEAGPESPDLPSSGSSRPLKRPGKGTAVKSTTITSAKPEAEDERKHLEALANYMHQAALDEVKRESRPKPVATPKLSGARSRDIHRQRVATNGSANGTKEIEMEDANEYIYDTYVLAPSTDIGIVQVDAQDDLENVGYLVITEDAQPLWETYLEDALSEKEWDTDEEDENAEDYYGADYPEEELASDDEYDRDPYGYGGQGGFDDEEWAEDTGIDSDDEYERMMSPFRNKKTPQQFVKYLDTEHGSREGDEDEVREAST